MTRAASLLKVLAGPTRTAVAAAAAAAVALANTMLAGGHMEDE